jgi:glutamate-ammonia-ligase adenylyltransferase
MGRLGGREMTATSDLDLILLYDLADDAAVSDGRKPLAATRYYTRLTQRLVAALSAPTGEGIIYPVDFRLRPSGKSGPLATHIDAFTAYQAGEAWTWEHMALTRARPIAGDAALMATARAAIDAVLRSPHDPAKVFADVREMRAMVEDAKGGEGAWDIKQAAGGLVDVEFIAQALQIVHAAAHPEIVATDTETALSAAARAGVLATADAEVLLPALRLYLALIEVLRLALDGPFDPRQAPHALLDRLAEAADLPDFAVLDASLRDSEAAVRAAFERIVGRVTAPGPD